MKRVGNLLEKVADLENLYLAFWKAGKGKRYAKDVIEFQKDLNCNLQKLKEQILSVNVEVGKYHYFTIYDPKERLICAAEFSERVLHHALMNICHPYFEKHQIYDSYASRIGKGAHAALERAKRYSKNYRNIVEI